jgi:hypothetical protein
MEKPGFADAQKIYAGCENFEGCSTKRAGKMAELAPSAGTNQMVTSKN